MNKLKLTIEISKNGTKKSNEGNEGEQEQEQEQEKLLINYPK